MLWLERKNTVWLAVNATDNKSQLHNRSHCKDFVNTRRTCRKNLTQAPMPLLERKCTCPGPPPHPPSAHGHSPRPHYPPPHNALCWACATFTQRTQHRRQQRPRNLDCLHKAYRLHAPSHRTKAGRAASITKKRASSAYVLVFSNTKHFENVCQQALTAHVF